MNQASQTLDEFLNGSQEPREFKRGLAVKMRAEKKSRTEIAQLLNVGVDYVTKWTGIYRRSGVRGLKLAHKGSQGYLGSDERAGVINWLKEQESWDLGALISYVEDEYQVRYKSKQSYYELMQEAGLSWKKKSA